MLLGDEFFEDRRKMRKFAEEIIILFFDKIVTGLEPAICLGKGLIMAAYYDIWQLFLSFFKIGAFTIGGGYAMVPLIQQEMVDHHKWLTNEEFLDILAIAQSAPGAIAINLATFCGQRIARFPGAVAATLGATLPSFFAILLVALFFTNVEDNPYVRAGFRGTRPAIVALILFSALKIGKNVIKRRIPLFMSAVALLALTVLKIHPILVIIAGSFVGYFLWVWDKKPAKEGK